MTAELAIVKPAEQHDLTAIERVLVAGDLSKLTPDQRLTYYQEVCRSLGLNPLTRPFDYITLSGRLTLYAKKDCTDQLRKSRSVSIDVVARERIDDLYVVTARATTKDGRHDEEIGAVTIGNLRGDALANALMKATTKAKRRVTLSICGLGMLDETELETIPAHNVQTVEPTRQKLIDQLRRGIAAAQALGADVEDVDPEPLSDQEIRGTVKALADMVRDIKAELAKQAEQQEAPAESPSTEDDEAF